ncbi:hypothetical protein M2119_000268 [Aurantimicrobium minutum]|uniref:Abi family protein n=1 Tax=Aurantimicrobium minutum TaxID=708131 RepID=UPI002475BA5A|nr:Abi family protein [Aurantimicrobium minutum]MDH6532031.1 hypothetical protein [Aurantimicrobium minutum]
MVNMNEWDIAVRYLAGARLRPYLEACSGNDELALRLYEWNTEISSALWESLSYLEVSVRNTIDLQMQYRQQRLGRESHWIFDTDGELGRNRENPAESKQPYRAIHEATRRIHNQHKEVTPNRIISELSFGFWHQMMSKQQRFLWPDLASGFRNLPSRAPDELVTKFEPLRDLRNRIGHHHKIFHLDVYEKFDLITSVASFVEPALADMIRSRSRLEDLLSHRPVT